MEKENIVVLVTAMNVHALMQNWMVNLFGDAFFCVRGFFCLFKQEGCIMSQEDQKERFVRVNTNNQRTYMGGTLVVTAVPALKNESDEGDEQIAVGDAALIAGYATLLDQSNIIGQVTVPFEQLRQKFSVENFLRNPK